MKEDLTSVQAWPDAKTKISVPKDYLLSAPSSSFNIYKKIPFYDILRLKSYARCKCLALKSSKAGSKTRKVSLELKTIQQIITYFSSWKMSFVCGLKVKNRSLFCIFWIAFLFCCFYSVQWLILPVWIKPYFCRVFRWL